MNVPFAVNGAQELLVGELGLLMMIGLVTCNVGPGPGDDWYCDCGVGWWPRGKIELVGVISCCRT